MGGPPDLRKCSTIATGVGVQLRSTPMPFMHRWRAKLLTEKVETMACNVIKISKLIVNVGVTACIPYIRWLQYISLELTNLIYQYSVTHDSMVISNGKRILVFPAEKFDPAEVRRCPVPTVSAS